MLEKKKCCKEQYCYICQHLIECNRTTDNFKFEYSASLRKKNNGHYTLINKAVITNVELKYVNE